MYFRVMEKIRNKEIYEKFKAGISADEIAQTEGISRARVYQIINSMKAREDNEINRPLSYNDRYEEKIATLEAKIRSLEETNDRLLRIIEKLTIGN